MHLSILIHGLSITELPLMYFIYEKPLLIDLPKNLSVR